MKLLIFVIISFLTIPCFSQHKSAEIIREFEKVMEEYNQDYTNAVTTKQQESVNKKWESVIDEAEKVMEVDLEKHIQAEQAALEKEQKEYDDTIETDEETDLSVLEKEIRYLKNNKLSAKEIAARYYVNNDKKNGASTFEIYKKVTEETRQISETQMSEAIYNALNK